MNLKDLKHKVEKEEGLSNKDISDFKEISSSFTANALAFVMKNMALVFSLVFTMLFYFIYSLFAHTREVFITALIIGGLFFVRKLIEEIRKYNNKK